MFRGVVVAYGISFVSGLIFFAVGLTPQTDPVFYPLLALLSGAIGVAVGLRVIGSTGPSHLVALGLGLWLLNLSGVLVGAQTLAVWLESSAFIAATVIAGRLLVGSHFAPLPSAKSSAAVQNL